MLGGGGGGSEKTTAGHLGTQIKIHSYTKLHIIMIPFIRLQI